MMNPLIPTLTLILRPAMSPTATIRNGTAAAGSTARNSTSLQSKVSAAQKEITSREDELDTRTDGGGDGPILAPQQFCAAFFAQSGRPSVTDDDDDDPTDGDNNDNNISAIQKETSDVVESKVYYY